MTEALGLALRPLTVENFSGGMSDFYVGAATNRYRTADNLLIIKYDNVGKLTTRPGSTIYDETYYQIPAGAQRIGQLKNFNSQLFFQSARKFYYISSGWHTLVGPSSNDVFPSGIDTTTVVSMATWNKHLFVVSDAYTNPQKIYKDGSAVWQLRTAGMPALASSPGVAKSGGTGKSFLYRFLYFYTYTVGTQTFEDRGAATEVELADSGAPEVNNVAVTAIPVLANSTTHNYDTASSSLKVEIYRTTSGGSNFFKVGSVNNGTTVYTDSTSDATLQDQTPLYTEGGAPDNDAPPLCTAIHVLDDLGYYGNIKIGSAIYANRIMQSVPGTIDAVPGANYADLQDDVVAISSTHGAVVVLCSQISYRLDGRYDIFGQGAIIPQIIGDVAGCISSASVVQTLDGVFWAGVDGFYYTDGYNVQRISRGINTTYASIVSTTTRKKRIVGRYDSLTRRIWWTAQFGANATECDTVFVLDLNWGLSDDMPFTTLSGGTNFAPTALEFVSGSCVRGDSRGYAFLHADTSYTDPKIDVIVAPSLWTTATIMFDYTSMATNFGTSQVRKWVPSVVVDCRDTTNLSLQVSGINDDGRTEGDCKPIRVRGSTVWGDPDVYWGDPDILWNFQGVLDNNRRFPASAGIRCQYKQVQMTNAYVAIISSDVLGTCAINATTHAATLTDAADFDWPTHCVDYYIAFDSDSYLQEYLVTARTADTLTFSDTGGRAVTSSGVGWVLRGYPRGEVIYLLGYTVNYALLGATQQTYRTDATGEPE